MVWGLLGDTLGRRKPFIVFGYIFKAFFYLLIARAATIMHLVFLQSAQAFLFGMHQPNSNALLAAVVDPKKRSTTAAILATVVGVAAIPAIFFGKWLVASYGIRSVFLPSAAFLLIAALLFLPLQEEYKKRKSPITKEVREEIKRNKRFFYLTLGTVIWAFGVHMVSPLIPPIILVQKLGFSQAEFAVLSLISTITALSLTIPLGIAAEKLGAKNFVAFAYSIGTVIILGYIYAFTLAQPQQERYFPCSQR